MHADVGPGFVQCHKAKNLIPDSGGKPSKIGEKVLELQTLLPHARIVYASATGSLTQSMSSTTGSELHCWVM